MHHELERRFRDGEGWIALAHVEPDGDALASLSAVQLLFPGITALIHASAPPVIARHAHHLLTFRYEAEIASDVQHAAGVLILDCSDPQRTGLSQGLLQSIEQKAVVIDHHTTNIPFGWSIRWPEAPSTTAMLFHLFRHRMFPEAATWLYYGLLTDTLGFRIQGMSRDWYHLAADMLNAGADHATAIQRAFFAATLDEIREGAKTLLDLVHPIGQGKAMIALDRTIPADSGYAALRRVQEAADIRCVVLLTEQELPNGHVIVRGSVRARPPFQALPIAEQFGGGGHVLAAGFKIAKPLHEVQPMVEAALSAYCPS
jgi:phosphoesterase RecJ-like protein